MNVLIALGSNLGNRTAHMKSARDFAFSLHQGATPPLCSPLYETDPVGCEEPAEPFLNAVTGIESPLEPEDLLRRLRSFERENGRAESAKKNAPRTMDLDLLCVGALRLSTPELTLPHPRMTTRRFVLQPLADMLPDLVLPGQNHTVAALLVGLSVTPGVRLVARTW